MTTTTVLDRLRSERDEARDAAIALAEADNFDPDSESFRALESRSAELDAQIEHLAGLLERRTSADALDGRISRAAASRRDDESQTQTRETWGASFVRSAAFGDYGMRGTSGRVEVPALETRALPTGIADMIAAGFTGNPTRVDVTPPTPPTPLLSLVGQMTVSTNAIEYVSWSKVAGGAAVVPEKGAKPSVEFGPTVTPATLDNIAVYTQLTRQLMEDEAAVASAIDGELRREILRAEEAAAAAALVAANLPTADGGGDLMAGIRVGMGVVQAAGFNPNAVLLNPADWAALDVAVWTQTLGGPNNTSRYWGLTPVAAASQPAGTATVGDFSAGVTHYARSAVNLYVTDSHADTFLSNVFTLLAERRSKTVVVRPAALVEVTAGTPGGGARSGSK